MTQTPRHTQHHTSAGIWPLLIMIATTLAAPALEGSSATAQANAGGGWMRLVFYSLSYVLAGLVVFPYLSTVLAVTRRMWTYLVMLVLILASASWSAFPDKVFVNFIHDIGLLLVAASTTLYGLTRPGGFFTPVTTLTALVVAASTAMVFINPGLGIEPNADLWNYSNVIRWRGITANSNTLGATAAVAACGSMVVFATHTSRFRRLVALATIPFSCLVLFYGCKSMTSILSTLTFIGVFLLLRKMENDSPGVRKLKLAALAGLALFLFSLVFLFNPDYSLADLFFKATGRSRTLTGRTLLWQIAAGLIEKKPLLGWSFDSIASVRKTLSGVMAYGQFHNGYLDITVRGGFVGLGLVLMMVLRSLRVSLKLLATDYRAAASALALLAFILVLNMAETIFFYEGQTAWTLFLANWMTAEFLAYRAVRGPDDPGVVVGPNWAITASPPARS